jgi:hypothetical protein
MSELPILRQNAHGIIDPNRSVTFAQDAGAEPEERPAVTPNTPRYTRRLSDKILIAFHHECDQSDFQVAEQLLHVLEMMLTRKTMTPDTNRRRSMESLVAAHERLWHLRRRVELTN